MRNIIDSCAEKGIGMVPSPLFQSPPYLFRTKGVINKILKKVLKNE